MRSGDDESRGDLLTLRIVWGAMLLGQVALAGIAVAVTADGSPPAAGAAGLLRYIAVAALGVVAPLSLFVRNQIYKANWRGDAITSEGYAKGNLVMLSMLESVAVLSLAMMFVVGLDWLLLAVAGAAAVLQLVNFPTGKPTRPAPPVFEDPERL